jgi:hypothetical protein
MTIKRLRTHYGQTEAPLAQGRDNRQLSTPVALIEEEPPRVKRSKEENIV